jgi:hypothetical protein
VFGGKFVAKFVRRIGDLRERILIELSDEVDERLGGKTNADVD